MRGEGGRVDWTQEIGNRNFSFPCGHLWSSSGSTACLSCPRALICAICIHHLDTGCPQAVMILGWQPFAKSNSCPRLSYPVAEDYDASILKGIWLCTMVSTTEGKSGNKSRRGDIISV